MMLEKQTSPKRMEMSYVVGDRTLDLRDGSSSCSFATSSSMFKTQMLTKKNGPLRKRVEICDHHVCTYGSESKPLHLQRGFSRFKEHPRLSFESTLGPTVDTSRDVGTFSTGFLDWLWSEDFDRQEMSVVTDVVHEHLASYDEVGVHQDPPSCSSSKGRELLDMNCVTDSRHHKFKDVLTFTSAAVKVDLPRSSSMSVMDLTEPASPQGGTFLKDDINISDTLSPLHHSSLRSILTSKRGPSWEKFELKRSSIVEPAQKGRVTHGVLHCTLRDGLPNYTFLVDKYDEVLTAKIWMEDMVLGEEHGSWQYTFYSLKGEGKKKGKSGWKHWKRKERLTSDIVCKMNVSSVLHSGIGCDGAQRLSVESEFVLWTTKGPEQGCRHQVGEATACVVKAGVPSQSCPSSLEMPIQSCSHACHVFSSTLSLTPQSARSSSDGCMNMSSSPGRISSWYVSQSLLPNSFAVPKKIVSKKWTVKSGIFNIQLSKNRRKAQHMNEVEQPSRALEDQLTSVHCMSQVRSELMAMIINVPLDMKNNQHLSDTSLNYGKVPSFEMSDTRAQIAHSSDVLKQKQQCLPKITVILPSGNHGQPLIDSKGPSPLIRRWKDGGKCDCKGWDLGCGFTVLSNFQKNCSCNQFDDNRCRQGKPLMLFKQELEHEEATLSLAPQENGLIALYFGPPLSPLQAFAIAVAILHGRESCVPNDDCTAMQVVPITTVNMMGAYKMEGSVYPSCAGVPSMKEVEEKMANGLVQLPVHSNQDMSQFHDGYVNMPVDAAVLHGDVGFERV